MRIEKKQISELNPAPYNPRQSTKEQEEQLRASLEKFGVVEPIVWNERTGHIVGGHFRVRELKKLGHKEVDCVIVDISFEDEKELNIRLNANTGGWDWDKLSDQWDKQELESWGLESEYIKDDQRIEKGEIVDVDIDLDLAKELNVGDEYIMIVFKDNDFQQAKEDLGLKRVMENNFDKKQLNSTGIERVLSYSEFKKRYGHSSTKQREDSELDF
jgi:hypothetical protein